MLEKLEADDLVALAKSLREMFVQDADGMYLIFTQRDHENAASYD